MATRPKKKFIRLYGNVSTSPVNLPAPVPYVRRRSLPEYHTSRWTKESKAFRQMNPLCALCEKEGIYTPSECTDHIVPAVICDDFFDRNNWQALCKECNHKKGQQDKKLIREYYEMER